MGEKVNLSDGIYFGKSIVGNYNLVGKSIGKTVSDRPRWKFSPGHGTWFYSPGTYEFIEFSLKAHPILYFEFPVFFIKLNYYK